MKMPIDYKKYPPNWKTEIRPAILERAGNCCEQCGLPNYTTVWRAQRKGRTRWDTSLENLKEFEADGWLTWPDNPIKVILTIAHLDHDETNHDVKLDRLKALCQLCHLQMDAKEKYRRVMGKPLKANPSTIPLNKC